NPRSFAPMSTISTPSSWPRMRGYSINGILPSYAFRSVPQIPMRRTRTSASPGAGSPGSAVSVSRKWPGWSSTIVCIDLRLHHLPDGSNDAILVGDKRRFQRGAEGDDTGFHRHPHYRTFEIPDGFLCNLSCDF